MRRFRYAAARPDGGVVHGVLEALHPDAAVERLANRQLLALDVREERTRRLRPLPRRACAVMLRGLGSLLGAGVPLDHALATLRGGPRLAPVIADVQRRVREGAGLAAALTDQRGMPGIVGALVRAGERSGLADACLAAADQLEREADTMHRVRAALTYPILLVVMGAGAVAVLVAIVLPRFVALLGDLGASLPWTTRALLAASGAVTDYWVPGAAVLILLAATVGLWLRTVEGQEVLLRIPGVGGTRLQLASARTARTLSALLGAGTPVLGALRTAAEASGNAAARARLDRAADRVHDGASLGQAMAAEGAADPQTLHLIAAGERSGRLPALLAHAADLADGEATRRVDAAVRLLEPGLIVLIGGIVAFIAMALLQAVYGLRVG